MHRILVIGTGSIGERHVRCLLKTERAVVGICEPMDDRREEVGSRYAIEERYGSLEKALESSWDAAVISVPAHIHIPIAQRLAEAGLHLLVEKPLSTSLEGVDRLIETVNTSNLVACVAYVYRAHPGVVWLKERITSGECGKPVQLVIMSGQHFPLYRPAYRDIYYADPEQGGGAIQDGLTHHLNLAEYLVGPIDRISADAAHLVLEGVSVEDTVHAFARHGEVLASYTLNQHQAPNETTVTVIFEGGTLRFELHENRCRWMSEPGGSWNDMPLRQMERDDWFVRQEHAFLDALERKGPVLCNLEEGRQTLQAVLATKKGVRSFLLP